MRTLLLEALFLLTIAASSKAGNENYAAGARSAALSHASVTLDDVWATFNNQAGLAYLKSASFGAYFENRFLVKEFAMQAGTFAIPFKPGTIALCYRYFGYSKYYESKFGLAYARKFTRRFSVGVQADFLQNHIADGYGNYNAIAAEIGLLAEPVDNFFVGFHLFNPNKAKSSNLNEVSVPTLARLGLRYSIVKKASIMFETEKDIDQKPIFKGGVELSMVENLFFRLGYASQFEQYSFGLGYKFRGIIADLAFTRHPVMGFTPQSSLGYQF